MARKVFLPLSQRFSDRLEKPTAMAMRERLGGRLVSDAAVLGGARALPLGAIVALAGSSEAMVSSDAATGGRLGVLLSLNGDVADVYVEHGIVKRTAAKLLAPHSGSSPADLALVAKSVLVFARLIEGQRVDIERGPGDVIAGTLLEKCRYGAIVELDDRALLGVGFRKISPTSTTGSPPS